MIHEMWFLEGRARVCAAVLAEWTLLTARSFSIGHTSASRRGAGEINSILCRLERRRSNQSCRRRKGPWAAALVLVLGSRTGQCWFESTAVSRSEVRVWAGINIICVVNRIEVGVWAGINIICVVSRIEYKKAKVRERKQKIRREKKKSCGVFMSWVRYRGICNIVERRHIQNIVKTKITMSVKLLISDDVALSLRKHRFV